MLGDDAQAKLLRCSALGRKFDSLEGQIFLLNRRLPLSIGPFVRSLMPANAFFSLLPAALCSACLWLACGCTSSSNQQDSPDRWLKGNLHTHSLWSDGDQFPEVIGMWYRDHGYDFLAISDHNTIADEEKWVDVSPDGGRVDAFESLRSTAGAGEPVVVDSLGRRYAKLATFAEYRSRVELPGSFILLRSEEITDHFGSSPIHINAANIQELIRPQGGGSVRETIQRNMDAVEEQRRRTGAPILPHLNHPNFQWGVTAADIAFITGDRFFEVYNGHPAVHNEGDATHHSTEEIWDAVLAARIARDMEVMYGLATDDAHYFLSTGSQFSNPGRGWVNVRSSTLSADSILSALEAGDFYASSGVSIRSINRSPSGLSFEIEAEPGATYETRFVISTPATEESDADSLFRSGVGIVAATDSSLNPSYSFSGNEMYVRAVVTSSKRKENPYVEGEYERAWIQPVVRAVVK